MASRKEQKEQARAARIAQEQQAAASKAQRNRRFQIIGGVIALAAVVVVVLIVVSSGGGGVKGASTGLATGPAKRQLVANVDKMLDNIPQHGATLGNPSAKVTMIYFGDLQCPICQAFTLDVFPQFVQSQVRPGNVKVIYRSSCTASCNNQSVSDPHQVFYTQQVAAGAAGKQDKFWHYVELFYHQQGKEDTAYVTPAFLNGIAKQVTGLHMATWQTDRSDPSLLATVKSDETLAEQEAVAAGVKYPTTPTLVMQGPKGTEVVTGTYQGVYAFPSPSELDAAVKAVS